jgi:hypothetical protein
MTHCEALLGMLQRGGWVTCAEILREHPMIVHSRVADLRAKGIAVEHETTGKGAAGSRYRLASLEAVTAAVLRGTDGDVVAASSEGGQVTKREGPGTDPSFESGGAGQDAAPPSVDSDTPRTAGRPAVAVPPDASEVIPGQLSILPPLPTRGWLENA